MPKIRDQGGFFIYFYEKRVCELAELVNVEVEVHY